MCHIGLFLKSKNLASPSNNPLWLSVTPVQSPAHHFPYRSWHWTQKFQEGVKHKCTLQLHIAIAAKKNQFCYVHSKACSSCAFLAFGCWTSRLIAACVTVRTEIWAPKVTRGLQQRRGGTVWITAISVNRVETQWNRRTCVVSFAWQDANSGPFSFVPATTMPAKIC